MTTTPEECIDALHEAARRLGASPTKAQYEAMDVTPASTTILRIMGGRNDAKERVGLETFTQQESGGQPVQAKPDDVEIPAGRDWTNLTPQQRWYYKNRQHRIEKKEARRKRLEKWLAAYKRANCSCERCSQSHPACLDFHHPSEKTMGISRMANQGYSRERILEEMEVCVVLCANCHREEHYGQVAEETQSTSEACEGRHGAPAKGGGRRLRRAWLDTYKRRTDGCVRCHESDPSCLDFHHTGPKTRGIAEMVSRGWSADRIRAELEKCELLCANCHRKEHHNE